MANESTSSTGGRTSGSGKAFQSDERVSRQDSEGLAEQIETLKADLANISATLTGMLKDSARGSRKTVEQTADYYMREGRKQADAAVESARAYGEALEGQIARNPFSAVLVALGLGFLVGLMSRR
jgi:ElaB/YqjD/DUF883 family membrane-anchored ribosome-binding protein